jgi:hypothetical protein
LKNFALISLFSTLVACSGSGGGGSKSNLEAYRSGLTQSRGEVTVTQHDGETFDIGVEDGKVTIGRKANVYTSKEIVLRIEGNEIYTLNEDIIDGKVENRYVRLDTSDPVADLQKLLDNGQARIAGNTIHLQLNDTDQMDYLGSTLDFTFSTTGTGSLVKPNCNFSATMIQNVVMNTNGVVSSIKDIKSTQKGTCDKKLSSAELKAINLSDVSFCDDSTDSNCENKDMSFLVNDL